MNYERTWVCSTCKTVLQERVVQDAKGAPTKLQPNPSGDVPMRECSNPKCNGMMASYGLKQLPQPRSPRPSHLSLVRG